MKNAFNRTCIEPERQPIFGPIGLTAAAARLNSDCCSLNVLFERRHLSRVDQIGLLGNAMSKLIHRRAAAMSSDVAALIEITFNAQFPDKCSLSLKVTFDRSLVWPPKQ